MAFLRHARVDYAARLAGLLIDLRVRCGDSVR
jgi:hypothetical protein